MIGPSWTWAVVSAAVVGATEPAPASPEAGSTDALPLDAPVSVPDAPSEAAQPRSSADAAPELSAVPAEPEVEHLQARLAELEARLQRIEGKPVAPPHPSVGADLVVPVDAHWSEAVAWSGDVTVHGAVSGPVVAVGGDVWVGPDARVEGHLLSLGGEIQVHPDAVVHGDRVGLNAPQHEVGWLEAMARRLSMILGMGAMVVLGVNLAEDRTRNVADTLRQTPGWYVVGGGVLALSTVVAGSAAVVSVVAAPLGLALFAALGLAWAVGVAGVCRWVGDSLPGPQARPWASALVGAVVLGGLTALPGIGPLVAVVVGLAAVGAGAVSRLGKRTALDI